MKAVCLSLLMVLGAVPAWSQDKTAQAMATLNVVLPRDAEERLALSAAPEHLRAGAAVYVYGPHGFERVRDAGNGFTCLLNRDAFLYGSPEFKPTCWDAQGAGTFLPVMLKVGAMLAAGQSVAAIRQAIDAGFASGQFRAPQTGGVAYMLAGDVDLDTHTGAIIHASPGHYMFYANQATNAQLGYTREAGARNRSLPFVTGIGAGVEHGLSYIIAIPGEGHTHPGVD